MRSWPIAPTECDEVGMSDADVIDLNGLKSKRTLSTEITYLEGARRSSSRYA